MTAFFAARNRGETPHWQALFLLSPSPGAVFRFLERRTLAGTLPPLPPEVLLSEPVAPHGFRLLCALPSSAEPADSAIFPPENWQILGSELSQAFPRAITLLWQHTAPVAEWGYSQWQEGSRIAEKTEALTSPSPLAGWLPLPGSRPAAPYVIWAQQRGLPVLHHPQLGRFRVRVVEYSTVAALDQRSLLVENSPRLYRFTIPPAPRPSATNGAPGEV
ncbi:MAG: hypothetical protein OHK0029_35910 [Armatimonadaceae bacterium]